MTLSAAASALGAPEAIVKRSAEARAKASGVSVDEILAAWAGGETVTAAAPPPPAPEVEEAGAAEAAPAPAPPPPTPMATPQVPSLPETVEPEEEAVPARPLRDRISVAGRVGFWSGVLLGVLGLLAASPWTLPNASVMGEEGDFSPALILERGRLILVTALFSVLFGAIVASLSRTLAGWVQNGGGLSGRGRTSALLGAVLGGVLGLGAGAALASFGQPVENAPELIQLPVVAAIFVVMIGGGVLGWVVAAVVQVLGVPTGVRDEETEEVTRVQSRLTGAIAVPLAGILALALLVLPLAVVLIRSNHLASGGAAILAIIASASILAIASLSASRPGMRISRGEFLLALGGIGIVVMIVFAVMLARNPDALHEAEEATATEETVAGGEPTETTVATTAP
ncbi:MAG TPA: hypothetical protein VJ815_08255 [Acidimicrobiia bacterium]|nr:hypothetical protein [Acidimicrobiia bacterium]